jgi:superfamily II DNA helicase RecQ
MRKYSNVWIGIMKYVWRVYKLHQREPCSSDDDSEQEQADALAQRRQGGRRVRQASQDTGTSGQIRPAFRLTEQQEEWLEKIEEYLEADVERDDEGEDEGAAKESKEDRRRLDELISRVLISLLDHNTGDIPETSILVTGLAVLGIDIERGWKKPLSFTPMLSAIVTIGRMLVLSHAVRIRKEEIGQISRERSISKKKAAIQATNHYKIVETIAGNCMGVVTKTSNPGPMSYVLGVRTYGLKIRYNTTAPGFVDWRGDTIMHGRIHFGMRELRSMIHGVVQETREELCKHLLLVQWCDRGGQEWWKRHGLPKIEWQKLADDQSETRRGWNFLQDGRNEEYLKPGRQWMQERVLGSRLRQEFYEQTRDEAGEMRIKVIKARAQQYLEAIEEFKERLLVLIHMCSGQPARGTEIITVKYKNSISGTGRGIFIEDGMMVYVTGYHKGYGISATLKIVHRYMPREVGELLFYYMWIVQPFWEELREIGGDLTDEGPYLWRPAQAEEQAGRDIEGLEDWEEVEQEQRARQLEEDDVAILEEAEEFEEDSAVDVANEADEGVGEANDGERTEATTEFRSKEWTSQRVGRLILRHSKERLHVRLGTLTWRHICIAIMRRYIKDGRVQRLLTDENPGEVREQGVVGNDIDGGDIIGVEDFMDEQAGHGARMSAMVYARGNTEAFGALHTRRVAFRRISKLWHQILAFDSALEEDARVEASSGVKAAWKKNAEESEIQRWAALKQTDMEKQLQLLLGAGARFRGVQKRALDAIASRQSPVVVVMGTGGGKSMVFMLPASCKGSGSDGITVVVVPLVALRGDMMRRCRDFGIECVEWSAREAQEWASIVLVTPEVAVTDSFIVFLCKQREMGRLDRIVIDECHTVLDTLEGWRLKMMDLRDLIAIGVQMVYLTATLPPKDVPAFNRITGIETAGGNAGVWLRWPTTRPNIRYRVFTHSKNNADEEILVKQVVDWLLETYAAPGKVIVYCQSVAKVERLAEVLNGICFYRGVGTAKEKSERVERLIRGEERVFTATNALGLGVDAPSIRGVVHVGKLKRLRDYAQESGRAGRDGAKSEAIILHKVSEDRRGMITDNMGQWAEAEMVQFVQTEGCRRIVLDRVMDGNTRRVGCVAGEEKCDACERREDGRRMEQRQTVVRRQSVSIRTVERMRVTDYESETRLVEQDVRAEFERAAQQQREWTRRERAYETVDQADIDMMIDCLERWAVGCPLCRVLGDGMIRRHDHELRECERNSGHYEMIERALGQEKVWEDYTGCQGCGVAQEICHSWRRRAGSRGWEKVGGGLCQYRGVLITAAAVMFRAMYTVRDWVEQETKQEGRADVNVFKWMGSKQMIGTVESNRMMQLVLRFSRVAVERKWEEVGDEVLDDEAGSEWSF